MSAAHHRRPLAPLVVAVVIMATLFAGPVGAVGAPSLRLFISSAQITVERGRHDFVNVDPGAWVTPVNGDFELWVSRPDYDSPITIKQVDAQTGAVLRTFSADNLDGWAGLKDFMHYEIADGRGNIVVTSTIPYCPNSYLRQRLSDDSPLVSKYPYFCGGGPFTKGSVWGLEDGWASGVMGGYYYGLGWKADRNNYTVTFSIEPQWMQLLQIPPGDATAQVHVKVVDKGTLSTAPRPAVPSYAPYPKVPTVTNPNPASIPDLVALPGWGMSVYHRKGHDYLGFNATEWNAGPAPLLVEGFREVDQPTMDAFQYFLVDGEPVGRAPIGQLEFHAGGGHNHWHFEEFTQYSLLDSTHSEVLISGKQSWCLAPTDAIDLTVPNANWGAYGGGLFTACGLPGSIWVREVLDVGWGDTYSQYVQGQAFDITDLPNGTYFVRTEVNPTGSMFESSSANNIEDRLIRLRGKPGDRRVIVPPWHGIDTENYCYYCG